MGLLESPSDPSERMQSYIFPLKHIEKWFKFVYIETIVMRLSRVIMIPCAIVAAYIAYEMTANYRYEWSYYLIPPIIIIAVCFSLYPQIDAIGYRWWPPKVDEKIKTLFVSASPSFAWIPKDEQDAFIIELMTLCRKAEFIGMKVDDIPTDVQAMCLYPGLLLERIFGIRLMHLYQRVVLYKHPFPSPKYESWHAAEAHTEDHVVLFSMDQLIPNYLKAERFYHVGFDAWIRIALAEGLSADNEDVPSFPLDAAQKYLGLEEIPLEVRHVYQYLMSNSIYQQDHPEGYKRLEGQRSVGV